MKDAKKVVDLWENDLVFDAEKAAEIAKESHKTKKSVRQICLERNILPKNDLEKILDAYSMTINS